MIDIGTAIDPKGLIGDPACEYANIFGNPPDRPDLVLAPDRSLMLARVFAQQSVLNARRILQFAAVHSVLSACWSLDEPQSAQDFRDGQQRLELAAILKELIGERRG